MVAGLLKVSPRIVEPSYVEGRGQCSVVTGNSCSWLCLGPTTIARPAWGVCTSIHPPHSLWATIDATIALGECHDLDHVAVLLVLKATNKFGVDDSSSGTFSSSFILFFYFFLSLPLFLPPSPPLPPSLLSLSLSHSVLSLPLSLSVLLLILIILNQKHSHFIATEPGLDTHCFLHTCNNYSPPPPAMVCVV